MKLDDRKIPTRRLVAAFVLAGLAACASAQQVYRIVGPDGRVTFSDQPPPDPGPRAAPAARGGAAGPAVTPVAVPAAPGGSTDAATGALPFELRQAANRYPVTLYSGPDCAPCNAAKTFLGRRGIPFTERTVTTQEDLAALQRMMAGAATLPFLTIGGQQLAGFSDVEWSQFLDAAGYPKSSQLPPSYRNPPATPLVAAALPKPPAPPAQPAVAVQPPAPPQAPEPPGDNPAGIKF